jgi:hypothetical protein
MERGTCDVATKQHRGACKNMVWHGNRVAYLNSCAGSSPSAYRTRMWFPLYSLTSMLRDLVCTVASHVLPARNVKSMNEISMFHVAVRAESSDSDVHCSRPQEGGHNSVTRRRCKTRLERRAIVRHISYDLSAKRGGGNVHRLLTRVILTLSPIVRFLSI